MASGDSQGPGGDKPALSRGKQDHGEGLQALALGQGPTVKAPGAWALDLGTVSWREREAVGLATPQWMA